MPFNVRGTSGRGITGKIKNILKSATLDARYDLREHIDVEVKDQMNCNLCWAFSANTSVETNLALNNRQYNFSERHLEYETANNLIDGGNENALNREIDSGGNYSTAFTYYSRGSGPILEEDMPFEDNKNLIQLSKVPTNSVVQKVDNMVYFPNIYKYRDENNNLLYQDANGVEYTKNEVQTIRNQVKEHIMNNGGVSIDIYAPNNYYNFETCAANMTNGTQYSNHTVTIIGWDDNFEVENFVEQPSEPGAYIVLNSYGKEWGDNGVYYISYEDCLVESSMKGVIGVSNVEYDNLYQHDTSEVWNAIESRYAANVFTSKNDEVLKEIMINSVSEQTCDIYVNTSGDNLNVNSLTKVAENINLKPGYNTVKIQNDIELVEGNKFAIVVEITSDNYSGIGIEDNTPNFANVKSNPKESFISEDGVNWTDIYDKRDMMNLSIKAYTQTKEKKIEVSEIKGEGYEGFGGEYSFSIKTSHLENGSIVDISICDSNNNKIESVNVKGNKIRGNGTHITLTCPDNLNSGEYYVDIKLSDFETIIKSFILSDVNEKLITIQFDDIKFLEYIRTKLQKSFYNEEKMQLLTTQESIDSITTLEDAQFLSIDSITGIEYLKNIEILYLNGNNITNIEKLKELQKLKILYLNTNPIQDITILGNLRNIEELSFFENTINDFSAIENLTNLKSLKIIKNQISNLDFLPNLVNLEYLDLTDSIKEKIDISNIFTLTNLKSLEISQTKWLTEKEMNMTKNLINLENLILSSCNIGNIEFLRGMNLKYLDISNFSEISESSNEISDLSPIKDMTNLEDLRMSKLQNIEKLNELSNLSNLKYLQLPSGSLRDASVLDSELFRNRDFYVLSLIENHIIDEVYAKNTGIITVKVPKIFEQASNSESKLYSSQGLTLVGCEWDEFGRTIKIDTDKMENVEIKINSGYAAESIYEVEIKEENIINIEISRVPNKTKYWLGEDLDLAGGKISTQNEFGDTSEISMLQTGVNIVDYDKTRIGEQTVTIEYEGAQIQFNINVTNELKYLEWYIDEQKLITDEYGFFNINLGESKEIKLYGIRENGEKVDLSEESEIYSKNEKIARIENGTINITDCGKVEICFTNNLNNLKLKEELIINVIGIKSIEILSLPEKTMYRVDESIDLTGGSLFITNLDETTEEISMTEENVEVRVIGLADLDITEPKIELTYKGKRIDFAIWRNTVLNFREIHNIIDNQLAIETITGVEIAEDSNLTQLEYLKLFPNLDIIWIFNVHLQDSSILNEIKSNNELTLFVNHGSINLKGISNQNITKIHLDNTQVYNLKDITNLSRLNELRIKEIEGYEDLDFEIFKYLNNLYIIGNKVADFKTLCSKLSELNELSVLYLENTNLQDKDMQYLANIGKLSILSLKGTYVKNISSLNNVNQLILPYGLRDLNVIYNLRNLNVLEFDGYTEMNVDSNILDQKSIDYTDFDRDISNKIEQIIENLEITDSTTEEEKVRKVTEYVVDNMSCTYYDNLIKSLDHAINYKEGGPRNYAMLEYTLLEAIGIEAYYVEGYVGESWNIVKLNGKWYGIDAFLIDDYGEAGLGWEKCYLKNPINDYDDNNYMFASEHKSYVNPFDVSKNLIGIEITTEPTKTQYILGEDLDFSGGIITLIYDNEETEEILMTSEGVNQLGIYDKSKLGEQTITIEYLGHKDSFTINVTNDIVSYQWRINDEVVADDITGIQIKEAKENKVELYAIKQNGEEECQNDAINMSTENSEIATYDSVTRKLNGIKGGNTKIVAMLETEGETAAILSELPITVVGIEEITVKTTPKKDTYIKLEDINLTDGVISIKYTDGTFEDIEMTNNAIKVTGYNKEQLGAQTIKVTYRGHTATFTVNVTNDIIGMNIAKVPDKLTYIKGEDLDFSGGLITLVYQDRTTSEILMTSKGVNQLGIYDKTKLGEQTITIEYLGHKADFKVNVTNYLTKIEVTTLPTKIVYIKGEELDLTGGIISLTYQDNTTKEVSILAEGVKCTETFLKNKIGEQIITIEYQGKKAEFKVEVIEKVIESEKYKVTVQNNINYIENIAENVSVEEFKKNITVKGNIEVYKEDKKIEDNKTKLSTGMVLKVTLNNKITYYNIVITGDVNGDGAIDQIDLLMFARYKAGFDKEKEMVKNAYLRATDIMKDNDLASDVDLLKFARVLAHLDEL